MAASLKTHGFKRLCKLELDESGKISREFVKPKQYQMVLYAFVIKRKVVYIGKSVDLYKRFDTYRNCSNWVSANDSNIKKNKMLVDAIGDSGVVLYVKQCPVLFVGYNEQSVTITSMHLEEPRLIDTFKPKWNCHYARS